MNSTLEYYPQGPSNSSAVRDLAEIKYNELISTNTINERSKFIEWCSNLNNE